jgi:hypothetical protein
MSQNTPETQGSEEEATEIIEETPHLTSSGSTATEEGQASSKGNGDGQSTKRKKSKRKKRKKEQPTGCHGSELDMEAIKEQYQLKNRVSAGMKSQCTCRYF